MSLKRSASESSVHRMKRKSMTLIEKLKICDKLQEGCSAASLARQYLVNESTIRTIKKGEKTIRAAVQASAPSSAQRSQRLRDKTMIKMENALFIWMQDIHKRGAPIDSLLVREKALALYSNFTVANGGEGSANAPVFQASKGWFDRFKRRFSLRNIKTVGESGSADHDAAKQYPEEFKGIIEEGGYCEEQVFNMDETALFWKKMTSRTFISREERVAPGFKPSKDRLTLLFCGNAAGDMIKPGLIYKSLNPRALNPYRAGPILDLYL